MSLDIDLTARPCSPTCLLLSHTSFDSFDEDDAQEHPECIHFASPTDALLAQLHLVQQVPPRYVDAFLTLLHHPHFKSSHLSFAATADIDAGVAGFRAKRGRMREEQGGEGWKGARFCWDLVPVLVRLVEEDREREPVGAAAAPDFAPFATATAEPAMSNSNSMVGQRLKALALTHRAFTTPAQRALGARLVLARPEHLRAAARSSLVGPWTHTLLVHSLSPSSSSGGYASAEDALAALVGVLQRAPNLTFLRVRTPAGVRNPSALLALLEKVKGLGKLETLVWLAPREAGRAARVDLERICEAVRGLGALRTLVVQGVRAGWAGLDGAGDGDEDGANDGERWNLNLNKLVLANVDTPVDPLGPASVAALLSSSSSSSSSSSTGLTSLDLDLTANPGILAAAFAAGAASGALMHLRTMRLACARAPQPALLHALFAVSPAAAAADAFGLEPGTRQTHSALEDLTIALTPAPASSSTAVLTAHALAQIPNSVLALRLSLLQLQPLPPPPTPPVATSAFHSAPSMAPTRAGSWRPAAAALRGHAARAQWAAQEGELVALLSSSPTDAGYPTLSALDTLEVVTAFQPMRAPSFSSFSSPSASEDERCGDESQKDDGPWTRLRAACAARGVALVLRTALAC